MSYVEYPKWLTHPHARPAVISDDRVVDEAGRERWINAQPGQAAQFPPVMVNNPDQEEYYLSRGYRAPADGRVAALQAVVPQGHVHNEYPRARADGSLDYGPNGPPVIDRNYPKWVSLPDGTKRIVQTAAEEAELCPPAEPSKAELLAEIAVAETAAARLKELKAKLAEKHEPDARAELLARAEGLGVKADRRWGEERLRQAIAEAEHAMDTERREPAYQESIDAEV